MERFTMISDFDGLDEFSEDGENNTTALTKEKEVIFVDDAVRMFLEFMDASTYTNKIDVTVHNPVWGSTTYQNYDEG